MKNLIKTLQIIVILLVLLTTVNLSANAQFPVKDKVVQDTTINKVIYKVYKGKNGGLYIIRQSKNTLKYYKSYLKRKTKKNV